MYNAFQEEEHLPFQFDGSNGGAILLVHGFPGSAKEMRPIAHKLHADGWTTRGILLPGFGPHIETLGERSHTEWQSAVTAALQELHRDHDTVILAGNSMGGALSLHVSASHPVDGLILFAPFWKIDHFLWSALPVLKYIIPKFKPFQLFKPDFDNPEFRKGTRNFMPNVDLDDPEFRQQTINLEVDTRIFAAIRAAGMDGYHAAKQVQAPTLVIQGTGDELVTPQATDKLITQLAGDVTIIHVDAEHNPLEPDKPYWDQVVDAVRAFTGKFIPQEMTAL